MKKARKYPEEINWQRRGHDFYASLEGIPSLYATETTSVDEKLVHAHYFVGGADWWIVEVDPVTMEAFGYCRIQTGEWGYVSLPELEAVIAGPLSAVVERDLHWEVRPFSECDSCT